MQPAPDRLTTSRVEASSNVAWQRRFFIVLTILGLQTHRREQHKHHIKRHDSASHRPKLVSQICVIASTNFDTMVHRGTPI